MHSGQCLEAISSIISCVMPSPISDAEENSEATLMPVRKP